MSSAAPGALQQFMSIASAALPAGFQVRFDTQFNPYVAPQTLLITGIHFDQDEIAVMDPTYPHEEHFNLNCSLASTAGSDDTISLLTGTYALYADISIAVANNPRLNNTVRVAWTRQLDYTPTHDAKGLFVGQLDFEVACQARSLSLS